MRLTPGTKLGQYEVVELSVVSARPIFVSGRSLDCRPPIVYAQDD